MNFGGALSCLPISCSETTLKVKIDSSPSMIFEWEYTLNGNNLVLYHVQGGEVMEENPTSLKKVE